MRGTRSCGGRWDAGRAGASAPLRGPPAVLDTPGRRRLLFGARRPTVAHTTVRVARRTDRILPPDFHPRSRLRLRQTASRDPRTSRRPHGRPRLQPDPTDKVREYVSDLSRVALVLGFREFLAVCERFVRPRTDLGGDPSQSACDRGTDPREVIRVARRYAAPQRGHGHQLQSLRLRYGRLVPGAADSSPRVGPIACDPVPSYGAILRGRAAAF